MEEKYYELTDEFKVNVFGIKLFRIKCTRKIKYANVGDMGGFVEKEDNLSGDAWVYGNAQVSGNDRVYGNAWVSGNADLNSNNKHCGFDCFGSANRHTHAYLTKENKVEVTCGCFRGSIEEFEKQVEKTHKGTDCEKQYKAIINVIKIKFNI